jgi:hypothetical protein
MFKVEALSTCWRMRGMKAEGAKAVAVAAKAAKETRSFMVLK